jgi:hypothetical protein
MIIVSDEIIALLNRPMLTLNELERIKDAVRPQLHSVMTATEDVPGRWRVKLPDEIVISEKAVSDEIK